MSGSINLYFKRKSDYDDSLDLDSLIKIASSIQNSYRNFLEINLLKKKELKDFSVAKKFLENKDKLIISDVKHGSFDITLEPVKTINPSQNLFQTDEFILQSFQDFDQQVISANFDEKTLLNINKNYTETERKLIWGKYFHIFDSNEIEAYKKNKDQKVSIDKPNPEIVKIILPNLKKTEKNEKQYGWVFAEINSQNDLNKKNIKKVHSINPNFSTDLIKFENTIFVLNSKLEFTLKVEDNVFVIENDYLDFSAWGDGEQEAKEAIYFSFFALYQNYYLEKDENLTPKAQELKNKLEKLIKKVVNL